MSGRRGPPVLADGIAQCNQLDRYRAVESKKYVRDAIRGVLLQHWGQPLALSEVELGIRHCLDNLADQKVIDPDAWGADRTLLRVSESGGGGLLIELPKWLAKWLGE